MRRVGRNIRIKRFIEDVYIHTPLTRMVILLVLLWLLFSAGVYFLENGIADTSILTYGDALYWGIAAFSTAGIADLISGKFRSLASCRIRGGTA